MLRSAAPSNTFPKVKSLRPDPSGNKTVNDQSETLKIKPVLRPLIAESWLRSQAAGVATTAETVTFHRVDDDDLQRRLQASSDVIQVARPHLKWLSTWLAGHLG